MKYEVGDFIKFNYGDGEMYLAIVISWDEFSKAWPDNDVLLHKTIPHKIVESYNNTWAVREIYSIGEKEALLVAKGFESVVNSL